MPKFDAYIEETLKYEINGIEAEDEERAIEMAFSLIGDDYEVGNTVNYYHVVPSKED